MCSCIKHVWEDRVVESGKNSVFYWKCALNVLISPFKARILGFEYLNNAEKVHKNK